MTPEAQKKLDDKTKRVMDAIALKEPDRVPITLSPGIFPILHAGYTVADVIYDTTLEKSKRALLKYAIDFDPDTAGGVGSYYEGAGPALELSRPKNMTWAGMPGGRIGDNSLQQYIEFPVLLDDEFEEFFADRTGWTLHKMIPRLSGLMEPFAGFSPTGDIRDISAQVSAPEFRDMIQGLWAVNDFYREYGRQTASVVNALREAGFPSFIGGMASVPFDDYSDSLRGTLLSLSDIFENTEYVERYSEEQLERQLAAIDAARGVNRGQFVFMALHKGMDGFMSREQYRSFYWKHLQKIIIAIIDSGKIPYVFAEGKYTSRLDFLSEVPAGKVYYRFEDVDMAQAKKKLGGVACISGSFYAPMLEFGTKQQVVDRCKELVDICAPGGGFIFETSCGLGNCREDNVEAMFDTLRTYGKY
jgi:hypothetical protein